MTINLKTGARNSALSITQTKNTIKQLEKVLPSVKWDLIPMSSPGDRDKNLDLKKSDPDFFTRDMDDAVINGKIDCSIHSAKDLPYPLRKELDWFWFPWREDPRDVLVFRKSGIRRQMAGEQDHNNSDPSENSKLKIGISSERREEYCRERFPEAELLQIRGNIDQRITQLDEGKYDLLLMAAAGLKRLGIEERISEYIPLSEMPPPAGQGYIALTFRSGDRRFETMRKLFVKPVVFAGAGPGNPEFVTLATLNELKKCDVCLYDSLAPAELLGYIPENAESVYVGKRSGKHSKKQNEICELITEYSRQGKHVVRLKGGDPGLFGRLAEEVDVLDELALPFRVIPGISSLNVATAGTGLLLTRRGLSRGFSVMTPRKSGSAKFAGIDGAEYKNFPLAFFMGVSVVEDIVQNLLSEGRSENEPATMVFGAGKPEQYIISGNLSDIASKISKLRKDDQPGLFLVGNVASEKYLYKNNGALQGEKVLITCSEALQEKAVCEIRRFGGIPIQYPLIQTSVVRPSSSVVQASLPVQNKAGSLINFDYANPISETEMKLPYWNQSGVTYFITFRLADSIPQSTINQIKEERALWIKRHQNSVLHASLPVEEKTSIFATLSENEKREYYRLFSKRVQDFLDAGAGSCCLKDPEIAKIVAGSLKFYDGEKYRLSEWVVMPNHVHVLVTPIGDNRLSEILHGWKSYTASMINKQLDNKGTLWQGESYDHIVRNKEQLEAIETYIRKNPENAKINTFLGSFDKPTGKDACSTEGEQARMPLLQRDWFLFTSPTSVKIFIQQFISQVCAGKDACTTESEQSWMPTLHRDLRSLPKIMVCGPGTACEFRKFGIEPDLVASEKYGAEGMLESAKSAIREGDKIIRWCSDKAGKKLSCELRKFGCEVEDIILYKNIPVKYENLPDFDSVIFASSSAVNSFVENFGIDALSGKTVSVIGKPTKETLEETGAKCEILMADKSTISGTCNKLAFNIINNSLLDLS